MSLSFHILVMERKETRLLKKHRLKNKENTSSDMFSIGIIVLFMMLLCGVIAGCITASYISPESGSSLSKYMSDYISNAGSIVDYKTGVLHEVLALVKYPIIVFCLGYTVFGALGIPAAVGIKGFLLSFSVASVFRLYGYKGLAMALAIYGVQSMISLPCLVVISAVALESSLRLLRLVKNTGMKSGVSIAHKRSFIVFAVCVLIMAATAVVEAFCTPVFVGWASGVII